MGNSDWDCPFCKNKTTDWQKHDPARAKMRTPENNIYQQTRSFKYILMLSWH